MANVSHVANAAISTALPASVSDEPAASVIPDIHQKYAEERTKRLDTPKDYVELSRSDAFHYIQEDLWVDHSALNSQTPPVKDGDAVKFLVLDAGYAGLLFAVRLTQAGFRAEDIRIVDAAGGFGGTWYWNRYPGLMCDTESYIYMPLLEGTGHMPKHKYAYGPELRRHADTIAKKWEDKALFRTEVKRLEWDDAASSGCALIGGPKYGIIVPEKVAEHVANMHALDARRSNRVRARVDEIIKDKETAEKLKAWYPGWCKRPTFHDDYLPAFNQPNVKVVDTGGKGRDGKNIDDKWLSGMAILHGVMSSLHFLSFNSRPAIVHDFPNLFFPGLSQAGVSANYTFVVDVQSRHVESVEAEEEWTMQIVYRAATFAAIVDCTPGYIDSEGEVDKPKDHMELMKAARRGFWGEGVAAYTKVMEA
ncbi:hypothetical protein C8R44DRAFT_986130 [Mycena epipterygia]|nr:hypothetical protein C8R44DRAFT_986130 [Mycena epipterygia]